MHNHPFIHQLLDLCQWLIPTNSSFNEPLFTVWKALRPLHSHVSTFFFHCLWTKYPKCLLLTAEYSDVAGVPSVLCKISFCNLTWECCQICRLLSVSQVLSDFTQSSPGARVTVQQPSKKASKQANGAAFLPEPGTKDLKQGHVMQDITFNSTASLWGQMIHIEWVCLSSPQC